jgi:hypothetical protein
LAQEGHEIWSATAAIIAELLRRLRLEGEEHCVVFISSCIYNEE